MFLTYGGMGGHMPDFSIYSSWAHCPWDLGEDFVAQEHNALWKVFKYVQIFFPTDSEPIGVVIWGVLCGACGAWMLAPFQEVVAIELGCW